MSSRSTSLRILCAIPVFNNAGTLASVARRATEQGFDVLVVDDGSTDADARVLLADLPLAIIRHPRNEGKGAALLTALRHAQANGYTHLVTLDADGQHDPADLPAFRDAIQRQPDAIVIGVRDFTAPHVPGSSRFGRRFSNGWIRLETGWRLADTQSGYRAYPVETVSRLRLRARRYDFEVEVLVRALWGGVPAAEIPIATWYAPLAERISHFHKWKDNARISLLHSRLVGRRLVPWPHRRLAESGARQDRPVTRRNDRGNALGFWFFRTALRFTGLRGAYGLLYFVCAWYALFDRRAVAAADAYVRRVRPGRHPLARRFAIYRLFIQQGKCLIDRGAFNAGQVEFAFHVPGLEALFAAQNDTHTGMVVLLAHMGGWQLALPQLRRIAGDRPVFAVMHAPETPEVHAHVRRDDAGVQIIPPESGPAAAVEMVARLQQGAIVSIMGDRAYGGQTVEAAFLGEPAFFPASAFAVARAASCPVLALFVPKTGPFSYAIESVHFDPPSRAERTSIRTAVQAYAAALDAVVRRYPDQCFLFTDIWRKGES